VLEQLSDNRLIRPQSLYTGPEGLQVVPLKNAERPVARTPLKPVLIANRRRRASAFRPGRHRSNLSPARTAV
jgi:hypothetical protein